MSRWLVLSTERPSLCTTRDAIGNAGIPAARFAILFLVRVRISYDFTGNFDNHNLIYRGNSYRLNSMPCFVRSDTFHLSNSNLIQQKILRSLSPHSQSSPMHGSGFLRYKCQSLRERFPEEIRVRLLFRSYFEP